MLNDRSVVRWPLDRLTPERRRRLRRTLRPARWGNLRRSRPISARFGFDRGTPVDRWYTDRFLAGNAEVIRGVVGEVADRQYVDRFGGPAVSRVEVIDLDVGNAAATIVADLGREAALPEDTFDCLIVTQVLQYVERPDVAVHGLVAALRPGGTLLLAVPALAAHDTHEDPADDRWRFWPAGVASLIDRAGPGLIARVGGYGNLVAAIAFLHGLGADELSLGELEHVDDRFPVVVCARIDRLAAGS